MTTQEVFFKAMDSIDAHYGNEYVHHPVWDVMFSAMSHALASAGDATAREWLKSAPRRVVDSVGRLEHYELRSV